MVQKDQLDTAILGPHQEGERDGQEPMDLDRLVAVVDSDGLIRLGLVVIEAFAKVKGRALWH